MTVTQAQIMQLLSQHGLGRIYVQHAGTVRGVSADDDDDDGYGGLGSSRRRRPKHGSVNNSPKVPSEAGQKLMESGKFGDNDNYKRNTLRKKTKLFRKLLNRELGVESGGRERTANRLLAQVRVLKEVRSFDGTTTDDYNTDRV